MFVRYTRNDRREARNAIFGEVGGVIPTGNYLFRKNDGITVDHVYTMSPSSLLNVRGGWQQFREPNVRQHEGIFDPASLGIRARRGRPVRRRGVLPALRLRHAQRHRRQPGGEHHALDLLVPADLHAHVRQAHDQAGYDLRLYREFGANAGRQAGDYLLRNNAAFTRQQDNSTSQNWQDVATFLVGLPTSGSIEINGTRLNNTWYQALFVQDDWRLSSKLTINLGLRYEYEGATTDSRTATSAGSKRRDARHHERGARQRTRRARFPRFRRRRSVCAAGCSSRPTQSRDSGAPTPTTCSRAPASRGSSTLRRSCAAAPVSTPYRSSSPARSSQGSRSRRRSYRPAIGG